jgi:hypothetical protein
MPTTGLFPKPSGKIVDRFLAHNLAEDVTPNASAATGFKVEYSGVGQLRTAKVTFTNYSLAITDATTAGAHGSLKLFDFPQARVRLVGIGYDLDMTAGSGGISDTAALVWSIGTAAVGTNNATLLTTEADIVASVAATLVGGTKTSTGTTSGNTIAVLTDSSGGTASDTLAVITGSYVETTIENTVASLAAKINALIPLVNGVLDGTSAAKSAYLNVAVPDAGVTDDVDDTLTITGTILFHWINEGAPAV